jgi:plastocyanin
MRTFMLAALVVSLTLGCGGGGDTQTPAKAATPIDPATTGTITARVTLDGTPPPMQELTMGSFADCRKLHEGEVLAGDMLVHDGKVQNAFVWIQDGLGDRVFATPTEKVVMDQQGCLYVPRVAGAQVGQPVEFLNGDAMLHNVHGTPKANSGWNVALSRKGAERTLTFDKPEIMISVRCDLHPWMQGWLGIVDHPYFGVTGADGMVTLKNVPAGDYTVGVWHERFGQQSAKVTVAPQQTAQTTFTLKPPAN